MFVGLLTAATRRRSARGLLLPVLVQPVRWTWKSSLSWTTHFPFPCFDDVNANAMDGDDHHHDGDYSDAGDVITKMMIMTIVL